MRDILNEEAKEAGEYLPSVEMRRFVSCLLSEECKGNKSKAERMSGVDRCRFDWAWFKGKDRVEFRKWFSAKQDEFLGTNETIVSYALMTAILKGDTQAIKTFYELRGKIKNAVNNSTTVINKVQNGNGYVGESEARSEALIAKLRESIQ